MKYFIIQELVSPNQFKTLSEEDNWKLFDKKLLETLEWIRIELNKPITINTWYNGGKFKYRGYREKACTEGAPKSAHREGKAVDFDVKGMSSEQVRQWIEENQERLPHPIRYEDKVNWVHIDTREVKSDRAYAFQV